MEEDVHAVLRNPQVRRHNGEYLGSMGFVFLFAKFSCLKNDHTLKVQEDSPMHMKKAFAQGSSVPPNNIAMSGITLKREKIVMMPN